MIKPCRYIVPIVLLCFNTISVRAQLCTGSLGDPVINIDFGAGTSTHGAALASGITSYTYSSADFPIDGSYTIENSTAGAGNVWWSTTDHTGNTGGYMMVVNASYSVTDYFYKNTVTGLCPNTTYEFAAWAINLLRSQDISPPNITFSIETTSGTVLNSYTTGSIPLTPSGPVWKKYGFYFTTPANVGSVVIRMRNNSSGGAPANDLAIDDITFRACGPNLSAAFANNSNTTLETCSGLGKQFVLQGTAVNSSYTSPAYQWQQYTNGSWTDIGGATSLTYTLTAPNTADTYQYRMVSAEASNIGSAACEVESNTVTLTVDATPTITTSGNVSACVGDALNLTATSTSTGTYSWTGPNNFSSTLQNPSISSLALANAGTYTVTLSTSAGCTASASVQVSVGALPVATASGGTTICQGSSTTLTASGGGTYSWSPTAGLSSSTIANPVATPTDTVTYTVTVTNASGCSSTASVKVNVVQSAYANAGVNKTITQGESVTLNGTAAGTGITYYWTPTSYLSGSTILNPTASPQSDITYTLHVVNTCGTATSTVFVRVYKKLTIPNTFTPNADNVNDVWDITNLNSYPDASVNVFNRYGVTLFSSTGYATPWNGTYNGKAIPDGTYYYVIDLKYGKVYSGWVVVKH